MNVQTRRLPLVRLAIVLAASGAAAPAQAQPATDMKLEDAGFIMRRADTPEKMAQLRKLPPRQFATRMGKTGRYFIWADPDTCQCAFVGTEKARQAFLDMRRARLPQPDNVPARDRGNAPTEMMLHDMDMDAGINVPDGDVLDYQF
jgi:hypothetical protein